MQSKKKQPPSPLYLYKLGKQLLSKWCASNDTDEISLRCLEACMLRLQFQLKLLPFPGTVSELISHRLSALPLVQTDGDEVHGLENNADVDKLFSFSTLTRVRPAISSESEPSTVLKSAPNAARDALRAVAKSLKSPSHSATSLSSYTLAAIRHSLDLNFEDEPAFLLASAHLEYAKRIDMHGHVKGALKELEAALALFPSFVQALSSLGTVLRSVAVRPSEFQVVEKVWRRAAIIGDRLANTPAVGASTDFVATLEGEEGDEEEYFFVGDGYESQEENEGEKESEEAKERGRGNGKRKKSGKEGKRGKDGEPKTKTSALLLADANAACRTEVEAARTARQHLAMLLSQCGKEEKSNRHLLDLGFSHRLAQDIIHYPTSLYDSTAAEEQGQGGKDDDAIQLEGNKAKKEKGPLEGSGSLEARESNNLVQTRPPTPLEATLIPWPDHSPSSAGALGTKVYAGAEDGVLPPALYEHLRQAFAPPMEVATSRGEADGGGGGGGGGGGEGGGSGAFWREHCYGRVGYFSYLWELSKPPESSLAQAAVWLHALACRFLPQVREARYVEFWAHCRRPAAGHSLHYDSDDEGCGGIRNPLCSTVLFLTGGVGGPTLVTNQKLGGSLATKGWLVAPRANRVAVFDAAFLHGVLPGRHGRPIGAGNGSKAVAAADQEKEEGALEGLLDRCEDEEGRDEKGREEEAKEQNLGKKHHKEAINGTAKKTGASMTFPTDSSTTTPTNTTSLTTSIMEDLDPTSVPHRVTLMFAFWKEVQMRPCPLETPGPCRPWPEPGNSRYSWPSTLPALPGGAAAWGAPVISPPAVAKPTPVEGAIWERIQILEKEKQKRGRESKKQKVIEDYDKMDPNSVPPYDACFQGF